jgi:hypothetical protein
MLAPRALPAGRLDDLGAAPKVVKPLLADNING